MTTDDDQEETGEEIVRALRSAAPGAVREALVGCHFYRDDPEDLAEITVVPMDEPVLVTRRGGVTQRLSHAALGQGYVIADGPGLRAALVATRTPDDERRDHADTVLARHRIKASAFSIDDRLLLAKAFELTVSGVLPDTALRLRSYQLLRDGGFQRQAIPLLQRWNEMLPADASEAVTVLIELAACYRHSGQTDHAFAVTAHLAEGTRTMPPGTRAAFACEHAALLMDLCERDGDRRRLAEARRWAGVAWHFDQSDYVSLLYQRLKSLEAGK